jgi:hypothetical protein
MEHEPTAEFTGVRAFPETTTGGAAMLAKFDTTLDICTPLAGRDNAQATPSRRRTPTAGSDTAAAVTPAVNVTFSETLYIDVTLDGEGVV